MRQNSTQGSAPTKDFFKASGSLLQASPNEQLILSWLDCLEFSLVSVLSVFVTELPADERNCTSASNAAKRNAKEATLLLTVLRRL